MTQNVSDPDQMIYIFHAAKDKKNGLGSSADGQFITRNVFGFTPYRRDLHREFRIHKVHD